MMKIKRFHRFTNTRRILLRSGLIWISLFAFAIAQDESFESGSDGSDGALFVIGSLAPTEDFAAVYDSAKNEVVVFGGQKFSPTVEIDHTYTFDGTSWNREQVEVSPSARDGAAIAYDSVRERVVLYSDAFSLNDCWLWDGSIWTEVLPPDSERAFYRFAMAFDSARGETIMAVRPEFNSPEMETWSFDGTTWTQTFPATTVSGQPVIAMTYDETLQKIIMLLRVNSSEFQTWTWDGTDWTQVVTDAVDIELTDGVLTYDGRTNTSIFLGNDVAYKFTGSNWIPLENVPPIFSFGLESVIYHPGLNALLRLNGIFQHESGSTQRRNETWAWYGDGSIEMLTSGSYPFDMSGKPDGIWNYTTIDIGPNVMVDFNGNEANTAVRWLASGDVNIHGTLDLSGKLRQELDLFPYARGLGGIPGPGGYAGGTAGPIGANMHIPGNGPGAGLFTGTVDSANGNITTYSNPWLFPLTGGSGAGNITATSGGGAGGGAFLLASSTQIVVDGEIISNGSNQNNNSTGVGSGGAILLRANTIKGDGSISAGRIRLEAWERNLDEMTFEDESNFGNTLTTEGPPLLQVELGENPPRIWVDTVNGIALSDPRLSSESQLEVDAFISGGGLVAIVVKGENIPDLAEIFLKVSLQDGTILEPDPAVYTGGQATINVDLPDGFSAIAATAKFPRDI